MYVIKPKPGDEVEIRLKHRDEFSPIEGRAVLVKRVEEGDTYYLDYEEFEKEVQVLSSLKKKPDRRKRELARTYEKLQHYFSSVSPTIKEFREELIALCSKKRSSYNSMYECVLQWADRYRNTPDSINNIFDYHPRFIVRFIQQTTIKNWSPTLFRSERWTVTFIPEDKFCPIFTTNRWIQVLVRICPKEDHKNTTYNGMSERRGLHDQFSPDKLGDYDDPLLGPSFTIEDEIEEQFSSLIADDREYV